MTASRRWHLRAGWGCRRPFWGVERDPFTNGCIWRVSLWANRWGFHVVYWNEFVVPRMERQP